MGDLGLHGCHDGLRAHHGLAQYFPLPLTARVAEGLAAGVVQQIPAIVILRAFQPHEQGRASGVFGMGASLCGIVLEWRIATRGFRLDTASSDPQLLPAFDEYFLMLAIVAAWQL